MRILNQQQTLVGNLLIGGNRTKGNFGFKVPSRGSSTLAAVLVSGFALTGCSSMPRDITQAQMLDPVQHVADKARSSIPSFNIRHGDSLLQVLRSLGGLDGKVYILTGDSFSLPGNSAPIKNADDLATYLDAHGFTMRTHPVRDGSSYVRVHVERSREEISERLRNCRATLSGDIPLGFAVTDVCKEAGLHCTYADPGALSYAGVLYTMSFNGACLDALDYLSKKGDLVTSRKGDEVTIRMMDTAVLDIGIPLRDRKLALDILADGRIAGSINGSSSSTSPQSAASSSGGAGYGGTNSGSAASGAKGMQSLYYSDYIRSIRAMLDSMRTPFGTWNYLHETGQVFVRDRAGAVSAVKEALNRMAQAMQTRYAVTLTLYRLTSNKNREIEGSIARSVNDKLSYVFGGDRMPTAGGTIEIGKPGRSASVINLLSEWGTIETLDSYDMMLQAGIPQTLKVAKNKEYIRNVSTTSTGVSGAVTSSVEQANATDGSFIAIHARTADGGRIAIDVGAFINKLDGFDVTQTTSSVVKSQNSFERTFDSMAVVDEGVPYLMLAVSQKTRDDTSSAIPGLEDTGLFGALMGGYRKDTSQNSYILVVLEARKR